jgi:hypothetical protein
MRGFLASVKDWAANLRRLWKILMASAMDQMGPVSPRGWPYAGEAAPGGYGWKDETSLLGSLRKSSTRPVRACQRLAWGTA